MFSNITDSLPNEPKDLLTNIHDGASSILFDDSIKELTSGFQPFNQGESNGLTPDLSHILKSVEIIAADPIESLSFSPMIEQFDPGNILEQFKNGFEFLDKTDSYMKRATESLESGDVDDATREIDRALRNMGHGMKDLGDGKKLFPLKDDQGENIADGINALGDVPKELALAKQLIEDGDIEGALEALNEASLALLNGKFTTEYGVKVLLEKQEPFGINDKIAKKTSVPVKVIKLNEIDPTGCSTT